MRRIVTIACGLAAIAVSLSATAQQYIEHNTDIQTNKNVFSASGITPSPAHITPLELEPAVCITKETRKEVRKRVDRNKEIIESNDPDAFLRGAAAHPMFTLPIQPKEGFDDYGYYTVNFLVDHNETPNGNLTDYHCAGRTYDWSTGNHEGTDFILWPYPWKRMQEEVMEIVAAAPGTIVDKQDGNFDMNCSNNGNPNWNGVVIAHGDGSEAWYWHFKDGAITDKEVGESVEAGEYLGAAGSSGSSNWPHLHFEVYNSNSELIDPWAGECNMMNEDSWWEDQQEYFEPRINHISTHYTESLFDDCPEIEDTYEQYNFVPGDSIFLRLFLKDIEVGTLTDLEVEDPSGNTYINWQWENTWPNDYATANVYWWYLISNDWPEGEYVFRTTFHDEVYETNFAVSSGVGLKEGKGENILIYPNPADDRIQVSGLEPGKNNAIRIFNLVGQEVYNQPVNENQHEIPSIDFAPGIYLIELKQGEDMFTRKLAIRH